MTTTAPLAPELRRLAVPLYFPWGMATLGAGVILPVLPHALELLRGELSEHRPQP